LGAQQHSLQQMQATIQHALADNPALQIQLRADAETPYAAIKDVLRACAEVGAYEVIYATYQAR
jgi:biopolymer transport protein ExbD